MNEVDCRRNPVYVSRDAGYSKLESISPENRKKARERLNNRDIVTRIELLSELYSKMGVIANPERMTNWYPY